MTAVRVSASANVGGSGTTNNPSLVMPAGIQTGDVGYLIIEANSNTVTFAAAPSSPIGAWTLVGSVIVGNTLETWLYKKTMDALDVGGTVQATFSSAMRWAIGLLVLDHAGAEETPVTWLDNSEDNNVTVPNVTPVADDALLVNMFSSSYNTAVPTGITPATGWTEQQESVTTHATGTLQSIWIGTKQLSGQAGVPQTGPIHHYVGTSAGRDGGFLFAIPTAALVYGQTLTDPSGLADSFTAPKLIEQGDGIYESSGVVADTFIGAIGHDVPRTIDDDAGLTDAGIFAGLGLDNTVDDDSGLTDSGVVAVSFLGQDLSDDAGATDDFGTDRSSHSLVFDLDDDSDASDTFEPSGDYDDIPQVPDTQKVVVVGCYTDDFMLIPANPLVPQITLNHIDDDGTRWLLQDIEGWWTLPPVSMIDIPRPQKQDGSYDVEGNYLARLITITGTFLPSAASLVPAKRSQLLRVLDTMRGGPLQIVANENPSKMAYARLADQPNIATVKANGQTDFQIALKCIDPRKYSINESVGRLNVYSALGSGGREYPGLPNGREYDRVYESSGSSSGQLNAFNNGSVPTPPSITISGPLTGPTVFNFTTGQELSFPGLVILTGQVLVIDVQEHSAVFDTSQRVSYLAHESVWWWLEPGNNIVRLLAESGTGTMTFTWRSAWME